MAIDAENTAYRAIAERNGSGWTVTIEGLPGPSCFHARDLAEVEPKALKLIWGYTGAGHADVAIDLQVRLPAAVARRAD